ncbi:gas vesicle accessory protein GvpU [Thalassolituus sp. UBA3500]|uniref:gas vesicle accessory protein GvpU n=1 Tax=Thalassolituus sp. UBA3500 TaxID=1947664 RepID=UPI00263AD2F5|nr:gas vesicle accessory protein GvpU [Thalassolituus sp. UBA3500]
MESKNQDVPFEVRPDPVLQQFVDMANTMKMSMGITLNIGGSAITGTLIGKDEYFETLGAQVKGALERMSGKPFEGTPFSSKGDTDEGESDHDFLETRFIHLKGAQIMDVAGNRLPSEDGILWRGRLSEITGFILGSFERK